jgi:hypothetical protein
MIRLLLFVPSSLEVCPCSRQAATMQKHLKTSQHILSEKLRQVERLSTPTSPSVGRLHALPLAVCDGGVQRPRSVGAPALRTPSAGIPDIIRNLKEKTLRYKQVLTVNCLHTIERGPHHVHLNE